MASDESSSSESEPRVVNFRRGPAGARARPAAEGASCDPPEELT